MKMKSLLAVAVASTMIACGGGGGGTSAPTQAHTPAPQPAPSADPADTAAWGKWTVAGTQGGETSVEYTPWSEWVYDYATGMRSRTRDQITTITAVYEVEVRECIVTVNGDVDSPAPTCQGKDRRTVLIEDERVEVVVQSQVEAIPQDPADTAEWSGWSHSHESGHGETYTEVSYTEWEGDGEIQTREKNTITYQAEILDHWTRECIVTVNGQVDDPAPVCEDDEEGGATKVTVWTEAKEIDRVTEIEERENPDYVPPANVQVLKDGVSQIFVGNEDDFLPVFSDPRGYEEGEHGHNIMFKTAGGAISARSVFGEFSAELWDVADGMPYIEVMVNGAKLAGPDAEAAYLTLREDFVTVHGAAWSLNNSFTPARFEYDIDSGVAYRKVTSPQGVSGIPVNTGSYEAAAEIEYTDNVMMVTSVQNNTIDANENVVFCDNDLKHWSGWDYETREDGTYGLGSPPVCGNQTHAIMASGKAIEQTLVVGGITADGRTDGAVSPSGTYIEEVIYFPGRSSSAATAIATIFAGKVADKLGRHVTASELKDEIESLIEIQEVDIFMGINTGGTTETVSVQGRVITEEAMKAYLES